MKSRASLTRGQKRLKQVSGLAFFSSFFFFLIKAFCINASLSASPSFYAQPGEKVVTLKTSYFGCILEKLVAADYLLYVLGHLHCRPRHPR